MKKKIKTIKRNKRKKINIKITMIKRNKTNKIKKII